MGEEKGLEMVRWCERDFLVGFFLVLVMGRQDLAS